MAERPMYQIGDVAERLALSLRTIRYYEETGLVPPSGRTSGGFRLYTDDDIERLELIKHMKPLDFSLDDMRGLLELRDELRASTEAEEQGKLRSQLREFVAMVEQRIVRLRSQIDIAERLAVTLRAEADEGRD